MYKEILRNYLKSTYPIVSAKLQEGIDLGIGRDKLDHLSELIVQKQCKEAFEYAVKISRDDNGDIADAEQSIDEEWAGSDTDLLLNVASLIYGLHDFDTASSALKERCPEMSMYDFICSAIEWNAIDFMRYLKAAKIDCSTVQLRAGDMRTAFGYTGSPEMIELLFDLKITTPKMQVECGRPGDPTTLLNVAISAASTFREEEDAEKDRTIQDNIETPLKRGEKISLDQIIWCIDTSPDDPSQSTIYPSPEMIQLLLRYGCLHPDMDASSSHSVVGNFIIEEFLKYPPYERTINLISAVRALNTKFDATDNDASAIDLGEIPAEVKDIWIERTLRKIGAYGQAEFMKGFLQKGDFSTTEHSTEELALILYTSCAIKAMPNKYQFILDKYAKTDTHNLNSFFTYCSSIFPEKVTNDLSAEPPMVPTDSHNSQDGADHLEIEAIGNLADMITKL